MQRIMGAKDLTSSASSKPLLSPHCDGLPSYPPIVCFHFVDDDDRGLGILAQDVRKQLRHALDKLCFLPGRGSLSGNIDVYIGHTYLLIYGVHDLDGGHNALPGNYLALQINTCKSVIAASGARRQSFRK